MRASCRFPSLGRRARGDAAARRRRRRSDRLLEARSRRPPSGDRERRGEGRERRVAGREFPAHAGEERLARSADGRRARVALEAGREPLGGRRAGAASRRNRARRAPRRRPASAARRARAGARAPRTSAPAPDALARHVLGEAGERDRAPERDAQVVQPLAARRPRAAREERLERGAPLRERRRQRGRGVGARAPRQPSASSSRPEKSAIWSVFASYSKIWIARPQFTRCRRARRRSRSAGSPRGGRGPPRRASACPGPARARARGDKTYRGTVFAA